MVKLVKITKSPNVVKKYRAFFDNGKHTDFGQSGFTDFTLSKDKEQRDRYRERHKKDLDTRDPTRAGYLSYYILWNLPSFSASVDDYKKRFNM